MSTPVASVGGTATVASNFLTLLLEGRPQAPERAPDWFTRLRSASNPRATSNTAPASGAVSAKMETQSSDRQAGTTPRADSAPQVGLSPIRLLNAAGTRPEPAV